MMPWIDLYRQHTAMREIGEELPSEIRRRLVRLAEWGHCDKTIRGRFTWRTRKSGREWYIAPQRGQPEGTEPLTKLRRLDEAHLAVLALMEGRQLCCFTVMLEGRVNSRDWAVAVHPEDNRKNEGDQKGDGACSHAAFHCHVGPTLEAEPKIRVPLPAVGPIAALDWVLSLVAPGWEPAPWKEAKDRDTPGEAQ